MRYPFLSLSVTLRLSCSRVLLFIGFFFKQKTAYEIS